MRINRQQIDELLNEVDAPEVDYMRLRRKKINKQNKDRARRMEQRVAEALGGKRTPLSGAGSIKGDGFTSTPVGLVILECKLSAQTNKHGPLIRLETEWFEKLRKDVYSTRAAFGILVIHFHDTRMDFVFIEERHAKKLDIEYQQVEQEIDYTEHKSKYITIDTQSFAPMFHGLTMRLRVVQGTYFICPLSYVIKALEKFEDAEDFNNDSEG